MEKILGVNLGNWLVLEKWMRPALFEGTIAEDEDTLCRVLGRDELVRRLTNHRNTWITKKDFETIKGFGMNAVRIPVPHFIFGDDAAYCDPYVPCIEYLDKAFSWAEETGLKILIDLHTAPESQNGFDNGGICGVCKWAQDPARVQRVVDVLSKLAERYGKREGLYGIEFLNEPISEEMWESHADGDNRSYDPERAKGSSFVPLSVLKDFYKKAYFAVRKFMDESKAVVLHDGFRFSAWDHFMTESEYKNVVLDAHWYLMLSRTKGSALDGVYRFIDENIDRLKAMEKIHPTIIGEWSLFNRLPQNFENKKAKDFFYQALADLQFYAWESGSGYFFWSYKTENPNNLWEGFSFTECLENGWITLPVN